jgi:hypothetical protein
METSIPTQELSAELQAVRAILQDIAVSQKVNQKESFERHKEIDLILKETDRIMKENAARQKETDEQMKRTDEQMKRTDERMGYLSNRFGEMAEHLVKPGIYQRFNELGYHFTERTKAGLTIDGEDGKTRAEIDLLLQNGDTIMAVEIKATPRIKHIAEHIRRLEILRDHRRKLNERQNVIDNRRIEGAIAGAIFGTEEKKATIEAGLYVIEQSGDTMKIDVPDGFVPRRW